MAAREILMVCVESSFGTAKTSPVLGTDKFYMRLDQGNAFSMEAEPVQASIPYGGGYNVEADTVADIVQCTGAFSFLLFPGIWSEVLLKWATTPVNSGRTAPWTTTDASGVMPVGDLASLSFYHAYVTENGSTYRRARYAGAKCNSWTLAASETGAGRLWRLSGNCTGIRPMGNPWDSSTDPDATEFPLPADADYPLGPYTFGHLGSGTGAVTLGSGSGTNRAAELVSLSVKATNQLAPNYYTGRFLRTNRFLGRASSCDAVLRFRATPDDRALFRALTAATLSVTLDNGTHTIGLDYHGNNLVRPWQRDLDPGREYQQRLTIANRYSNTAGGDFALTTT